MLFRDTQGFLCEQAMALGSSFTEPDDDWKPHGFVFDAQKHMIVMSLMAPVDVWVPAIVHVIREKELDHPEAVGIIASAWVVTTGSWEETIEAAQTYPNLEDAPERAEVVQVTTVDAERIEIVHAEIIRTEHSPPDLGEWQTVVGGVTRSLPLRQVQEALR